MGLRLFGCGVAKTFRSSGQPWDSREDSSHLRDVKCGTELPCHAWTSRRRHCALFPVRWRDERQSWFDIDAVWLHWRMHLNTINGVNDCEWLCIKAVWLHLKQFWLHLEMVLIDRFCVAERRRNGSWRTICLAVLSKILLTKNQIWQKNVLESRSWLDDWRRNAPLNRQKTESSIFGQNGFPVFDDLSYETFGTAFIRHFLKVASGKKSHLKKIRSHRNFRENLPCTPKEDQFEQNLRGL